MFYGWTWEGLVQFCEHLAFGLLSILRPNFVRLAIVSKLFSVYITVLGVQAYNYVHLKVER